jgi:septal ring factor EnvC (AmiA/AmiB activator)
MDLNSLTLSPTTVLLMGVAFVFALGQLLIGKEQTGIKATNTLIDIAKSTEERLKVAEESIIAFRVNLLDKERKIIELQSQITILIEQGVSKDEKIAHLENEISNRDARIARLEKEVRELKVGNNHNN